MFSSSKLGKTKSITSPAFHMNQKKKYTSDLTSHCAELCNRSFDTAQTLYNSDNQRGLKNLRQTRLGIRQCTDDNSQEAGPSKKLTKKSTEFFLLPLPTKYEKTQYTASKENYAQMEIASKEVIANPVAKNGRDTFALLGKVDFCLKMHKLYPHINALWSVFGKLIKMVEGKNRFEKNLLLRNSSGDGPVLKCFFYDFGDGVINQIRIGDTLRVVGRLQNENSFHAYNVENTNLKEESEEDFSRLQNVISFVLLQKHTKETDK